jgi:hypothetical protein
MIALLAVSFACLLAVSAVKAETYPAKYDNLDVDALLINEEKVNMFGGCLLDDAICTEKALKLKGLCVFKNISTGRFSYLSPRKWQFYHTESLLRP